VLQVLAPRMSPSRIFHYCQPAPKWRLFPLLKNLKNRAISPGHAKLKDLQAEPLHGQRKRGPWPSEPSSLRKKPKSRRHPNKQHGQ